VSEKVTTREAIASKKVKDEYKTLPHVEDMGLVTRFLTQLCGRVERACQGMQGVTCRFIDL
jgi:hypothetical protein